MHFVDFIRVMMVANQAFPLYSIISIVNLNLSLFDNKSKNI